MTRRLAAPARLREKSRARVSVLEFAQGGAIVLRAPLPLDEETARAEGSADLHDLVEGAGRLAAFGLVEAGVLPQTVSQSIGLSNMVIAAHLASLCFMEWRDITDELDAPLGSRPEDILSVMLQDHDASRTICDWSIARRAFWATEGNVLGSPSSASGAAGHPSDTIPPVTPMAPEPALAPAS